MNSASTTSSGTHPTTGKKKIPTLTYLQLEALYPCSDSLEIAVGKLGRWRKPLTVADAARAGINLDDLTWVAEKVARTDKDVERRFRLWLADCAAHVLHISADDRPAKAVEAARLFARGQIDGVARNMASSVAWSATRTAGAVAQAAARAAARDATRAAARAAVVMSAEEAWQLERLIAWFSAEEPEDWVCRT